MLTQDHLALRLIRLTPGEPWVPTREGLAFVFPRTGAGSLVAGSITRLLSPGDVLMLPTGSESRLCASASGLDFWSFSLRVEHLFPLFDGHELSLLQNVVDSLKYPRLYPASTAIAQECQRLLHELPPAFSLDHRSQLLRVASAILSIEFKRERSERAGFVGAEELLTHVLEKLSISDILDLSVD